MRPTECATVTITTRTIMTVIMSAITVVMTTIAMIGPPEPMGFQMAA